MISNSGIRAPELLPAAATVALNPGCQWNCTTFCGDLSFNTSVLRQRRTHLVVAAQNKWCRMKENVKKSSQNCRLSLNFCYRYLHLMASYVHGNIFLALFPLYHYQWNITLLVTGLIQPSFYHLMQYFFSTSLNIWVKTLNSYSKYASLWLGRVQNDLIYRMVYIVQ